MSCLPVHPSPSPTGVLTTYSTLWPPSAVTCFSRLAAKKRKTKKIEPLESAKTEIKKKKKRLGRLRKKKIAAFPNLPLAGIHGNRFRVVDSVGVPTFRPAIREHSDRGREDVRFSPMFRSCCEGRFFCSCNSIKFFRIRKF